MYLIRVFIHFILTFFVLLLNIKFWWPPENKEHSSTAPPLGARLKRMMAAEMFSTIWVFDQLR